MTAENRHPRTLRATLCEIERGLFYATYAIGQPDADKMPAYQVATDPAEAKQLIEQHLRALGYSSIIWEDALVVPLTEVHNTSPAGSGA